MSVAELAKLTPDDLLAHADDGQQYELVEGELQELNISGESSWVAGKLLRLLGQLEDTGRGWLFPVDAGFRCFAEDPDMVRKPDVAFVLKNRLRKIPEEGFITVVPDLVVEVVSPHDLAYQVEAKTHMWLTAGCHVVWVVMPRSQTVIVHAAGADPVIATAAQTLSLPTLLPDFTCRVADLFPPVAT